MIQSRNDRFAGCVTIVWVERALRDCLFRYIGPLVRRIEMLYPLRFQPLWRRYLWGGRRLATVLNKPLGEGNDYAESWEVVDRGVDQSRVAAGPLAGWTLHDLIDEYGPTLLGSSARTDRFPLLLKFLDCQRDLSVQVHPKDEQAARLSPPDLGKTEAWVVIQALPGSRIYAGLKRGFDRPALQREVARGTTALCLHAFEPQAGDCVFIPAGTVHALGAGLLVAEIQQSSDTTFRLFDWNRVGPDGQPRELHIEQALETIDYDRGPVHPQTPQPTERPHVERLVTCEYFVMDRWRLDADQPLVVEPHDSGGKASSGRGVHLLAILEGAAEIAGDATPEPAAPGQTLLIPAAVVDATVIRPRGPVSLLDIYLPVQDS
jgi:mannose-6-phosphate isomerase